MDSVYIIAIVVIACSAFVHYSLKKRIEELGETVSRQPLAAAPEHVAMPAVVPAIPSVVVSPVPSSDEEMAAVVMAAIAAYEYDMACESESETVIEAQADPVPVAVFENAPALAHEAEKYKYRRRGSLWTATARYENHKRL